MKTLITHLQELGAVKATKVNGPNGAFISYIKADGSKGNVPVGGNSQNGKLAEYKMFITDDGVAIATVNEYKVAETLELNPVVEKETV